MDERLGSTRTCRRQVHLHPGLDTGMGEAGGCPRPGQNKGLKMVKIMIVIISGQGRPDTKSLPGAVRSLGTVVLAPH